MRKKTLALFGIALVLMIAALVIGIPATKAPPPPLPDIPPTQPTPPPGQSSAFTAIGDVVQLKGTLSNGFMQADHPGSIDLLMDLNANDVGVGQRPTMAIALVIDRSGSMAGEKIRQARRAAKSLVARLKNADQISLVTYSSDYSVDLPLTRVKGQRNRINRIIDDILDGGGTNLAGGMQAGLKALRSVDSTVARRLLLLSDGNANQGITDPTAIARIASEARRKGITISTLGVGVDFNEDLMTLVAQSAAGGYYYARNADAIATAFDQELTGLVKLAARNVEVGLELGPNVTISEVYGYRTEMRRGRIVVPVGDMAGGEKRRVMVRLNTQAVPEGKVAISNIVLSYRTATSEQEREHQGALGVVATLSQGDILGASNRDVSEAFEAATAARVREQAAFSFQSGDKAKAVSDLKRQLKDTRKKSASLKSVVLQEQVTEMEATLDSLSTYESTSEDGKDLVKREKLRARQVFAY